MASFVVPNTPEMRYVQAYSAIVKALASAAALFDVISQDGSTVAIRDDARAQSTQALLELEMAKDQHEAWMLGQTSINPPSSAQVQHTINIATALAQITAAEQKFQAILNLLTQAVTAISAIHGAGVAAPAPTPAATPAPGG